MLYCSVGAHIRDAAAYVCWALARTTNAQVVRPLLTILAPALLTTACYDREVMLFTFSIVFANMNMWTEHVLISSLLGMLSKLFWTAEIGLLLVCVLIYSLCLRTLSHLLKSLTHFAMNRMDFKIHQLQCLKLQHKPVRYRNREKERVSTVLLF